ncbi:MAG: hypothetical protein PVG98_06685 [Chromatiales bacterium]|jgi:hypothetical protein
MRLCAAFLAAVLLAGCASAVKAPATVATPIRHTDPLLLRLAAKAPPARLHVREPYRCGRELRATGIEGLTSLLYRTDGRAEIAGFALANRGSPRVNPRGYEGAGAVRYYRFAFPDRAREDIYLTVNDDVAVAGRYSHDNMFRELHFFPRLQLPSIERVDNGRRLEVRLPTGEPVLFDARTREIVGGVLVEEPMDVNPNRHARHNPEVGYRGRGLVITVAQRGEAPRLARVWGRAKQARAYYPAKYAEPCRISPGLIWDQRPRSGDTDPRLTMRHPSDLSLFALVEDQCGWDLTELARAAGGPPAALQAAVSADLEGAGRPGSPSVHAH